MTKYNQMTNKNRFATHPIFDIDGLDWLCEHLSTTPAKFGDFNTPSKGDSDYSVWQERCACIGMIQSEPARALCSLLVWGNDKQAFDVVREYLAEKLLTELKKTRLPKGCVHDRADLAGRMAYMVWHLYVWNMWDLCTVKGRLYFAGIEMSDKTYNKQLIQYQRLLIDELSYLLLQISNSIHSYAKKLKYT